MKKLLAGLLCCFVASAFAADSSFETVIRERIAAAETPACIAVALVADSTREALGCTEGITKVPFDRHSAFEIGSITKGLTGILLADMVVKGEVSLDDPASKYSRPGAKLPTFEGKEITLRDLVTQTSGLPRLPPGFAPKDPANPYADFDADALYAALARTELTAPIGKTPGYSNFGFMWLSEMLARRGGKHYDALLKERVLDPLDMTESFFVPNEEQLGRLVQPHALPYVETPPWDMPIDLAGVGMLRSSLFDMEKLAYALAGRRDTPLKAAIALALEPIRPAEMGGYQTGFAWVTAFVPGARIRWHNGGTGGSRAMIAVNEATKTAAVVLVNSAVSFDDLPMHLVDSRTPLKVKHVSLPLDPALRDQYVGRYDFGAPNVLNVFVDKDLLMTRMTGQPAIEIVREGTDKFYARGVEATLEFNREASGRVVAVTLRQGGREIRAARLP
jgi:serine-type D-Ala-D-Ala carboxypeptidase/endopeptidase